MSEIDPERAADLSASALARAFLVGAADPVEVTEVCLARIGEAKEAAIFLAVTPERARREAAASRSRYAAGRPASPLDGVPVAWKDLFDMAGTVTTAGSALLANATPAERDSPVVAQLAAAGMVAVGKTNLTEFAFSALGLNPHFGTPANPHDATTPRVPGGSSSGSAVAVAARLVPTAIGSDTGGSVRVPAAFNGLVGHKSSEGRIRKDAVFALSDTLDTVGPLCRTVEDCVLMDAAMRGTHPVASRADLASLHIVVPETLVLEDCEPDVADAFEAAIGRLERAGVEVEWRVVPELAEAARISAEHGTLTALEAYANHRERIEGADVGEMDGRVVARILGGKRMSGLDVLTVINARRALSASLKQTLDGAFLAFPTVAHVAPEIGPLDADPDEFHKINLKTLRNTSIGNFLNTPGVAMPMASSSQMPVSLLLSATAGEDDALLSAALAVEKTVREG